MTGSKDPDSRVSAVDSHSSEATRPMSVLQQKFVDEYLIDLNGSKAATRAGYSARSSATMASRLLSYPHVAAAIDEGIEARAARARVTADRVIDEYARIAFSDMRRFVEWGPGGVTLKASDTMRHIDASCVAEVTETKTATGGTVKFKLHDKRAALDALSKHLGLFIERGDDAASTDPSVATVIVNIKRDP
jgi:phage terminase small subunit